MLNYRIIPVLLVRGSAVVKTVRFAEGRYIGDAINAVSIFNEKMVDELIVLDIDATRHRHAPRLDLIKNLAGECFMPLCYGGGVRSLQQIETILATGVEKVALNSAFVSNVRLVVEAARSFGSQSIVVAIDARQSEHGRYQTFIESGGICTGLDAATHARRAVDAGAGEVIIQSIDRDGTRRGYDLELVRTVTSAVPVPVVALGGARTVHDLAGALVAGGAAAAAAGSMFVYYGRLNSVLINVPDESTRAAAIDAARAARSASMVVEAASQ